LQVLQSSIFTHPIAADEKSHFVVLSEQFDVDCVPCELPSGWDVVNEQFIHILKLT
jgi:uncharacterized protein YbdZ (MbtH family)